MGYVEEVCIVALLSAYIHLADVQQTAAYQIYVMVPNFTENMDATVVCKVNNTELNAVNCPSSIPPITRLKIILSNDSSSTGIEMCVFSSFLTCTHGPPVSALECGCYHDGGDIYTVNVTVRADRAVHENKTIDCRPNCINANYQYGLVNTVAGVPILFDITTTTTITTTTLPTTPTTTPTPPFPYWSIAPIVIGIFIVIIVIVVCIIKKCKKEKKRGNRFHCCSHKKRNKRCCPCGFSPEDESSSNHVHIRPPAPRASNRIEIPTITPAAQDGKKWTETILTTASGGNNGTEQTIQDAKEMQDRNKHLGTDNSPEREKRRKKKKKKKTFQEVDGEPVSGEDKSTVNDHKAAQNDNSIYVTESSHGIDNGGHRSLPMPKLSHLTSVERNSTIFQSETPRKLPPLQLKQ